MESIGINEFAPAGYMLFYPPLFQASILLGEYILLTLIVMIQLPLFAIQMPFFRNGSNHLDFQKKSENPEAETLYSMAEIATMCYSIVTKWFHSLLALALPKKKS